MIVLTYLSLNLIIEQNEHIVEQNEHIVEHIISDVDKVQHTKGGGS